MGNETPFFDVRMKGFRDRAEVADVLHLLKTRTVTLESEVVPLQQAAGRVLASPVVSAVNVPGFVRAAMDGYAVRASDKSQSLLLIGDALPGRPFVGTVEPGQAVRVMTGAPIPAGADAVHRAEVAEEESGRVTVRELVAPGKHVGRVGEDVAKGCEVLPAGRRLRAQDVGLLASIGIGSVSVIRRPRIAILVTGDELLPPGAMPEGCRIVDSNSPMLTALVDRDGGTSLVRNVPDQFEAVRDAIRDADADVALVSGGSSVGKEDHAPRALAELGALVVHGIALRPAGPTGIGFVAPSRIVFLLPGNPVSCLCAYDLFAGRTIRRLGGRGWELPYRKAMLPLASPMLSATGRVDYVRVKVANGRVEPMASSGASNLSSTVAADGFVLVDRDRECLAEGEMVEVWLYDE